MGEKFVEKLKNSPINYFSDLFVVAMVVAWIVTIIIMMIFAIYSNIKLEDTSVWSYVWELVGIPLSAGGAMWMLKNSVQHAIANQQGRECKKDFPKVPVDNEEIENETPLGDEESEDEEAVG